MRTWTKVAAAAVLVLAPLAAGSDDDDAAPATTVAKGADTAFCKAAKQIAEQDGFPTVAQVEAYGKAAPEDIQDDVAIVRPVVRDHDDPVSKMAAFAADDVEVATQHMNAD